MSVFHHRKRMPIDLPRKNLILKRLRNRGTIDPQTSEFVIVVELLGLILTDDIYLNQFCVKFQYGGMSYHEIGR